MYKSVYGLLVKGGQGKSRREVTGSSCIVAWSIVLGVIIIGVTFILEHC